MIALDKINRSEMSRQTGIDIAHFSRIFTKKSRPSLALALTISGILGVTMEELCESLEVNPIALK